MTPKLTRDLVKGLEPAGPADPIELYKRPILGRLFLERINRGLAMLPGNHFEAGLEIGFGAGAVQLALKDRVKQLHGIAEDADPEQVMRALAARGVTSKLVRGSPAKLPYPDGAFELVVAFSVFQHLGAWDKALAEVALVLKPASYFLLGIPAQNSVMTLGFTALRAPGADGARIATTEQLTGRFAEAGFRLLGTNDLVLHPPFSAKPVGPALYHNWLLTRLQDER